MDDKNYIFDDETNQKLDEKVNTLNEKFDAQIHKIDSLLKTFNKHMDKIDFILNKQHDKLNDCGGIISRTAMFFYCIRLS